MFEIGKVPIYWIKNKLCLIYDYECNKNIENAMKYTLKFKNGRQVLNQLS